MNLIKLVLRLIVLTTIICISFKADLKAQAIIFSLEEREELAEGVRIKVAGFFLSNPLSIKVGDCDCNLITDDPNRQSTDQIIHCILPYPEDVGCNTVLTVTTAFGPGSSFFAVEVPAIPVNFESGTPSVSDVAQTSLTLNIDTDNKGTIYYVVVPDGDPAPDKANVRDGLNAANEQAIANGNQLIQNESFTHNFNVTGLTQATDYDIYVVAGSQETPTKIDVRTLGPEIAFTSISGSGSESSLGETLRIESSSLNIKDISFDYTVTGTAERGSDHNMANGALTIPATTVRTILNVSDILDDTLDELDETIVITLSNPTNAVLGANKVYTYTITDNDPTPTVTLSQSSPMISEAGATNTITATLSAASGKGNVVVNIAVKAGATATVTDDYTLSSATITIPEGATTGTATLTAVQDALIEANETLTIEITGVTNALEDGTQEVASSIIDDDTPLTVVISSDASNPQSGVFTATFTFDQDVTGFAIGDINVGNGSASNFIAVSAKVYTATITPASDGVVTVDVAADKATNGDGKGNTAATQLTVTNDATKPTVTITSSANPTSGAFTATFTFSEDVTGFELGDITVSNGAASNFNATSAKVYTATITPVADGAVTVDVASDKASDGAGNGNTAATQLSVTNDETKPTLTITSNANNPQSGAFIATFIFSEDVTGFEVGDITVGNGAASNFNATSAKVYTATITPAGDGAITVDVSADKANDAADNGNTTAARFNVTNDETKPTVTITSSANPSMGAFTATFTFSEDVTGFAVGDITLGNGAASDFNAISAKVYTATITPAADGAVTLDVAADQANDATANGNTAATQLSVTNDETRPALTIKSSANPTNTAFTATFTFSEDVTGFELNDIQTGNGTASGFVMTSAKVYTALITPTVEGMVTVDVAQGKAHDLAGNSNEAATQLGVTYDITAPTILSVLLDGDPEKGDGIISYKVTFSEKVDSASVDDFKVGLISGFASGIVSKAKHVTDTEVSVDVFVEGSLYNSGDQKIRLELRDDHNIADPAGNKLTEHDNSTNEVHTTNLTYDNHPGKWNFTLEADDIPESSPIQLNSQSIGLLIPAIGNAYPDSTVRVEFEFEDFSLNRHFYTGNENMAWDMKFTATIFGDNPPEVSEGVFGTDKAVVITGDLEMVGKPKVLVNDDGREVMNYSISSLNFATVIIKETNIGPVNTFLLKFKLNLATVGLVGAINERFTKIEYPLPPIMVNEIGFADVADRDSIDFIELYDSGIGNLMINGGSPGGSLDKGLIEVKVDIYDSLDNQAFKQVVYKANTNPTLPEGQLKTDSNGYVVLDKEDLSVTRLAHSGVDPDPNNINRYAISFQFNDGVNTKLDQFEIHGRSSAASEFNLQRFHGNQRVRNDSLEWAYGLPTKGKSNSIFLVADTLEINENASTTFDIQASGGDRTDLEKGVSYALSGGADQSLFNFDASTGVLSFKSIPDFENPQDADKDNKYLVEVKASRAAPHNDSGTRTFVIEVKDVDDTPPTVTITSDAADPQKGAFTATFTFSEAVTGFVVGDITVGNGAASNFNATSGTVYTATITPAADGAVTVDVAADKAIDAAGNGNSMATQLSVANDETKPTVVITSSANPTNGAFTTTFTFGEDVTGFELGDITVGNGVASSFNVTSAKVYSATVTPNSEGPVTIDVIADKVLDAAGNGNTAATQLSVTHDETKPSVSITSSANPTSGAFTATFTFSEEVTGFEVGDIAVGNGATSNFNASSGKVYTSTITPASDGAVTIDVAADKATDAAGNGNTVATQLTIINDEIKPTVILSAPTSLTDGKFVVTAQFSETVTGFEQSDITTDGTPADFIAVDGDTYTFSISSSGATATVSIAADKATDVAGNMNTESNALTLAFDTMPPEAPTIDLTAASDSGSSSTDNLTNDDTPTLEGVAEANAEVEVFDGATSVGKTNTDASGNWSLTPIPGLSEGAHQITAKATDAAGNTSESSVVLSITIDKTTPIAPSVTTISEDTGSSSSDGVTSDNTPTKNGTAEASSIVEVFVDGVSTGTTTADTNGDWNLAHAGTALADGSYSFTAKATDAAGNTSAESSAFTAIIDTANPEATLSSSAENIVNAPFTVSFSYDETVSGFELSDISVTNGTASDFSSVTAGKAWTAMITPTAAGDVEVSLATNIAEDTGGNGNNSGNTVTRQFNTLPSDIGISSTSIDENNEVGDAVGTISTTDPDEIDNHVYSLISGAGDMDNSSFTIDGDQLKAGETFDFETKTSYSIRIKSDDGVNGTIEKSFTIEITNVLEGDIILEGDLVFNRTALGIRQTKTLMIRNIGEKAVEVRIVSLPSGFTMALSSAIVEVGESIAAPVIFSPLEARSYSGQIIVEHENGTASIDISGEGAIITSIDNGQISGRDISLRPNPANHYLTIDLARLNGTTADLEIYNLSGIKMMSRSDIKQSTVTIDVSRYNEGLFLLFIKTADSIVKKKVIIKH